MDKPAGRQPAKRMRLGTKSCAECRRRKVRCIFPPNDRTCQGCALHQIPCTAQQPRTQSEGKPESSGNSATGQRVAELEGMVRRLYNAIEPGAVDSSSPLDLNAIASKVMKHLKPLEGDKYSNNLNGMIDSDNPSTSTVTTSPTEATTASTLAYSSDSANCSIDAPLIHLFKDAMMIKAKEGEIFDDPEDSLMAHQVRESVAALKPPIPDVETIHMILEDTKKFWPVWPTYYYGPRQCDSLRPTAIEDATNHITQALIYGRGVAFCKALLWLTLCIQQLPRKWSRFIVDESLSRQTLIDSYLRFVNALLSTESGENLDGIQCYLMQYKLLINMGRPQRAWLSIRRAVNASIIMGIHHIDVSDDTQRKGIWSTTWQIERQMSLLLGFPSATCQLCPHWQTGDGLDETLYQRIFRRLAVISGNVIDRNQNRQTTYSTTIQLDQEMEELRLIFPLEWWDPPVPDAPLHTVYYQETTKLQYFLLLKLVHVPYMLKFRTDRKYEHSRLSTMEASRELVKSYLRLRNSRHAQMVQCELMDFQAFSAAVTLIIGLLHEPNTDTGTPSSYSNDWQLVEDLAACLRRTTALLECSVTEQGARVLETLIAASHGMYNSEEELALVVPYFGRLRIKRIRAQDYTSHHLNPMLDIEQPRTDIPLWFNTVEFSGNDFLFDQFSSNVEMELGQDWTTIENEGNRNEWNYTFTNM